MPPRPSLLIIVTAAAAALSLAACGSSSKTTPRTTPSGPAYQTSKLQISTENCGPGGGGITGTAGHCVIVLSDGARYRCPQAQTGKLQSAAAVTQAAACTKLAALRIPAGWKPVLKQLDSVRGCLSKARITVTGGATLGLTGRSEKTPIGELTLVGTSAPTLINFYQSSAAAEKAAPGLDANSRRSGGSTLRSGAAIVAWSSKPDANERASEQQCLNS
jgi:hypothetical protein